MEKMRALIANTPSTYREVIADVLREVRPNVEVNAIDPDGLDAEISRLRPHLVVCSRPCDAAQDCALTWVVLYPHEENRAEVFTAGERATITGVGFSDLLSIVDTTELLCRA